jgi:uncharacterized DUF497 family protein
MKITFDRAKRERTLKERGLDFADAVEVFAGPTFDLEDNRLDYGETRTQTYGLLRGRLVVVVWTRRGEARQIISMRKCNAREEKKFRERLAESG